MVLSKELGMVMQVCESCDGKVGDRQTDADPRLSGHSVAFLVKCRPIRDPTADTGGRLPRKDISG